MIIAIQRSPGLIMNDMIKVKQVTKFCSVFLQLENLPDTAE
jgi:hypothetical protein